MKKFNFRLQRVLDFRNVSKKEKALILARENARLHEAEQQMHALENQYGQQAGTEGTMTMAEFLMQSEYVEYLRKALDEQEALVEQAVEAVELARNAYIEKAIESETLETLKRKRAEEYQDEQRRDERRTLDKQVVSRHRFKKGA